MRRNPIGLTAAALAAAGVVGVTGTAVANASDHSTSTSTASPSTSPSPGSLPGGGEGGSGTVPGGRAGSPVGGSPDEVVTGDEAKGVIDAVEAEDAAVTVETVRKDPDGSYDAIGTRDGRPVFFEVGADLQTVTERQGGRGGPRGQGGGCDGGAPAETDGADPGTSTDPSAANAASVV